MTRAAGSGGGIPQIKPFIKLLEALGSELGKVPLLAAELHQACKNSPFSSQRAARSVGELLDRLPKGE
jgi:hypothetical protein